MIYMVCICTVKWDIFTSKIFVKHRSFALEENFDRQKFAIAT